MCELFGLSCNEPDRATRALPVFAERGSWCEDGWGIGYFKGDSAVIAKSADLAFQSDSVTDEFVKTMQAAKSHVIVAHVRYATRGITDECNSHPFRMRFLERDWLFAHNGDIPRIISDDYPSHVEPYSETDSARAFTYILSKMSEYLNQGTLRGFYIGIKNAISQMRNEYGGKLNMLLSDGDNLYIFNDSNHRPIYYLQRTKSYGPAFLVTTIRNMTDEEWNIVPENRVLVVNRGQVFVVSDPVT